MEQKLIKLRFREDTAENWALANPVLDSAEPGYELDTGFYKIGDGKTDWNNLDYANTNSGLSSSNSNGIKESPADGKMYVRQRQEDSEYGTWVELPQTDINVLMKQIKDLEQVNSYNEWLIANIEKILNYNVFNIINETDLLNAIKHGGELNLESHIKTDSLIDITKDVKINLNNHSLTHTYELVTKCPVQILNGTTIIEGKGSVNSYHYAANVNGESAKLRIHGGDFYSESASVIQVQKGVCEIHGGTFRIADEMGDKYGYKYTLNAIDSNRAKCFITVYGGSFYKFNPAIDNPEVTVAKGYRVIQEGDWYKVVVE